MKKSMFTTALVLSVGLLATSAAQAQDRSTDWALFSKALKKAVAQNNPPDSVDLPFPIKYSDVKAQVDYLEACPAKFQIGSVTVEPIPISHPNRTATGAMIPR